MPALYAKHIAPLNSCINTMHWRMLQLHHFHLTHDECLELVAPPEHINILKTVAEYADVSSGEGYMDIEVPHEIDGVTYPIIQLMMRTHEGKTPPLRPRGPFWHPCDQAIRNHITSWVHHRMVQGRMSATTKWVVQELAEKCDKGEQVRYMYPAIMHLFNLSDDEDCRKWRSKHGVFKSVRSCPAISPELRKAMVETSTWLTQGSLLEDISQAPRCGVHIHLKGDYTFSPAPDVILTRD